MLTRIATILGFLFLSVVASGVVGMSALVSMLSNDTDWLSLGDREVLYGFLLECFVAAIIASPFGLIVGLLTLPFVVSRKDRYLILVVQTLFASISCSAGIRMGGFPLALAFGLAGCGWGILAVTSLREGPKKY